MAHQLVAAAERSDDGEVHGRCNKEKPEMGENLSESPLRCQVNAHGHVVEYNEGDKRRRNLKTGREKV
jgi:hypothetical protein